MYFILKTFIIFVFLFEALNCQNPNDSGCPNCQDTWCPKIKAQCPYGLVDDICECCPNGVCAKIEGEDCYDENLVPELPLVTKKYGSCGKDLRCEYSFSEEEYKNEVTFFCTIINLSVIISVFLYQCVGYAKCNMRL